MTDGRYALSIELGSENFGMAVLKSDLSLDTGFGDDGVLAFPAKIGLASRPQILGNGKLLFADAGNAFEVDPNAAGATILPIRLGVDGELIIQGTHLNDQINVEHIGQDFRVILNGKETDFAADQVNFVTIDAAKGNDFVRLQGNAPHSLVLGGPGDDTIFGGKGSDNLSGGDGNDSLRGGGGSDQISGNGGNDIIRGDDGADSITGGGGNDRLFGNDGSDHINGGKGNDRIYGGNNDDAISGGDGNDTILADAGNDHLNGGNGADFLNGGDGQDFAQIDKADRKIINVEGSSYF
jgi:Ca2+-binding RTX toxin-like protein